MLLVYHSTFTHQRGSLASTNVPPRYSKVHSLRFWIRSSSIQRSISSAACWTSRSSLKSYSSSWASIGYMKAKTASPSVQPTRKDATLPSMTGVNSKPGWRR